MAQKMAGKRGEPLKENEEKLETKKKKEKKKRGYILCLICSHFDHLF